MYDVYVDSHAQSSLVGEPCPVLPCPLDVHVKLYKWWTICAPMLYQRVQNRFKFGWLGCQFSYDKLTRWIDRHTHKHSLCVCVFEWHPIGTPSLTRHAPHGTSADLWSHVRQLICGHTWISTWSFASVYGVVCLCGVWKMWLAHLNLVMGFEQGHRTRWVSRAVAQGKLEDVPVAI